MFNLTGPRLIWKEQTDKGLSLDAKGCDSWMRKLMSLADERKDVPSKKNSQGRNKESGCERAKIMAMFGIN